MFKMNLQLFADGAAGGETGVASATAVPGAEGSVETQSSPENDRQKAYGQFKTDYKAEFDAEVQSIVKDRLKKSNAKTAELNTKLKGVQPILEAMANRYKVDVNDLEALGNAFADDDAHLEDEAYEKGMTVEQLKAFKTIERENNKLKRAEAERAEMEQYAEWDRQAEALQQIYPSFDMSIELQNPQFCRMLNAGVDVKNAFEQAHRDEFIHGAMQFATQKATEKVTNAVMANKARPSENGVSPTSGSVAKTNIASLSREQMEDMKRRALAGERITFKN